MIFILDLLNKLDDPCKSVRIHAVKCVAELQTDKSDEMFNESSYASIAEMAISRLILYLDDPYVPIRPILLGGYINRMPSHAINNMIFFFFLQNR